MEDYEFEGVLLGCTVRIIVTARAQVDWRLDHRIDQVQIRMRAERLAIGILSNGGVQAGEHWTVKILDGEHADGARHDGK